MIKTYKNWNGSLNEYLQVGDRVDEEMVKYFINTLPPATLNGECIQMGEPYGNVNGKATFATLRNIGNGWEYAGNCHIGEIEEPQEEQDTVPEITFNKETCALMLKCNGELLNNIFIPKHNINFLDIEDIEQTATQLLTDHGFNHYIINLSEFVELKEAL